ncbi:hypothetical protein ACFY4C_27795 [Actinomadura viridis]|uniref:hypothetical protein n=1 Tax=Actinomadura viridis TaxID=58110 RepID=UPI00369384AF
MGTTPTPPRTAQRSHEPPAPDRPTPAPTPAPPPAARRASRSRFSPRTRKTVLLLHVISSMTWLGLDIGLLMLSVTGFVTDDPVTRRAAYLSMNMIGDTLLVPASLLALATGILLGIGTAWGLVRYRWVLIKLVVTIVTATLTIFALRSGLHEAAAGVMADPPSAGEAGVGLLAAPLVSLTCYIAMTALSVFKPWGRTRWGRSPASSA